MYLVFQAYHCNLLGNNFVYTFDQVNICITNFLGARGLLLDNGQNSKFELKFSSHM